MSTNSSVIKIAELPDSNGKTIICKKIENNKVSYLFKTVWGEQETKWEEVSVQEAKHVVTLHFGAEKAAELIIGAVVSWD